MPEVINAPAQSQTTPNVSAKPEFGSGRYSALMQEVYDDAQVVFKLNSVKAEKLARAIATELGVIMAKAPVEVRLGKLPKKGDAKLTITEASKIKGVTLTYNILALKALHFAGDAGQNGFSFARTQWSVTKEMQEYFDTKLV